MGVEVAAEGRHGPERRALVTADGSNGTIRSSTFEPTRRRGSPAKALVA
jgi:hypothetical protein